MLDYIKKQLKERNAILKQHEVVNEAMNEEIDNDVILEYAHLFQELDELSVEGSDVGRVRKLAIDIPIEDDIEINTIEMDFSTGRITDVPMDAMVQEQYNRMKSFDDFYQESCNTLRKLPRETDAIFHKRCERDAETHFAEYCAEIEEKGLFGHNKMNLTDNRVPSTINVDFGKMDNSTDQSFFTKLKVYFETNKDHQILKKQLEPIQLVQENHVFSRIGEPLMTYLESKYDIPEGMGVWDIMTPKRVIVPKATDESYCVVIEFANELTHDTEYFGWTRSIKEVSSSSKTNFDEVCLEEFVNARRFENPAIYIQECANRPKKKLSRFYQEAIDFGGGDGNGDGGSDLPPSDTDDDGGGNGDDSSPSIDAGDDNGNDDASTEDPSVDTDNASDAPESNEDSDDQKEEINTNDVSKQIAEKVAQKTDEKNQDDGDDEITFDDDGSDDELPPDDDISGMGDSDDSMGDDEGMNGDDDIDARIDDLDSNGGDDILPTDEEMGDDTDNSGSDDNFDAGDEDFGNMTMDQLMSQGTDKLKGMTFNQIKDFIKNNDNSTVQEAFLLNKNKLTKKNINSELYARIRKVLGILNDNQMKAQEIFKKFKDEGKLLNKALIKASHQNKIYSESEVGEIKKLNNCLVELSSSLKNSKDEAYVAIIKKLITSFTAQSNVVTKIIESKLEGNVNANYAQEQEAKRKAKEGEDS